MKRLLSILLLLILLSAATVWLAPVLVDFNVFRQDIEKQISAKTGRDVSIAGDISIRLIPEPGLEVHKVSVAGKDKDGETALAVDELRLNAEFWPLLNKQVKLTSVHLLRPEIHLHQLGPAAQKPEEPTTTSENNVAQDLIAGVSLDAVKIIDGRISFSKDAPTIEKINAELRAPSLAGPFSISGTIGLGELALATDLTTGRLGEGQTLPVEATFMTQDTLNSLSYNGVVNLQGDTGLNGNFQVSLKDPANVASRAGQVAPAFLGRIQRLAARGKIALAQNQVQLSGLELTLDESTLNGDVSYIAAADDNNALLNAKLTGAGLDLSALSGGGQAAPEQSLFKTLDHTDLPKLPVDINAVLSFERVVHGKITYEDVLAGLTYKNGALTVDKLNAVLPGRTRLSVKGGIAPEGVREAAVLSNFDIVVDLETDKPDALFSAFDLPQVELPGTGLTFLGKVQGATNGLKVQDATVKSGDTELGFSLSYVDSDPPRVELTATCNMLAVPKTANGSDGSESAPDLDWIKDYKASFDLSCDRVVYADAVIRNLKLTGHSDKDGLRLAETSGFTLDTLNIKTSGKIGRFSPPGDMDVRVGLAGTKPAAALARLGIEPGTWASMKLFDDVDLVADFSGDVNNASFTVKGDLSGIDLQLGGTAENIDSEPVFDGKIRLQHQDAAKALDILLPETDKPGKIYGNLDLYTEIKGDTGKLDLPTMTGKIGDISFSGKSSLRLDQEPLGVDVTLQSTTIDLNKLGLSNADGGGSGSSAARGDWSDKPLGRVIPRNINANLHLTLDGLVCGKTTFKDVASVASMKGGVLTIEQLDANALGGRIGITGAMRQPEETLSSDLDLTMSGINSLQLFKLVGLGDAIDGQGDVTVALKTAGASEKALIGNLNGTVTYLSTGGMLNGVDLKRVSDRLEELSTEGKINTRLLQALNGGKTPYESAQADIRFKNGIGTITVGEVKTETGHITGEGRIDLPKWRLNIQSRIKLLRPEGVPAMDMTLTGPLHSPQKQLGTDLISQYLADKFARALEKKLYGDGETDPNAPDSEQKKKKFPNLPVDPEDAFKNLLKNL